MSNNIYFRGNENTNKKPLPPKKKIDFKKMKKNTVKSLNEVEGFLHDFHKLFNYIKLYNILK